MTFIDLFSPKWKHSNWKVRKDALKKISNQKILINIALNDNNINVRKVAVSKIEDQIILTEIAKKDPDEDVRITAISQISNQNCLLEITKSNTAKSRAEAIRKIKDPYILAEIAKNDPDYDIRLLAGLKSEDQTILGTIAKSNPDYSKRRIAVEKLTDLDLLDDIKNSDTREDVRLSALIRYNEVKRESCKHVFSEWESAPCCIDAPYCNCDQTVGNEIRKCKLCGLIMNRKIS